MRPAITLLITLSVIATMIALMGVMFKYLDVAREKAEVKASMIQANLLGADMVELLHHIIGKKKNPSVNTMQTLFETPLGLRAESGEFTMGISCGPLANRINIAWLETQDNNRSALARSLFEMLTDRENIRDSALLRQKIGLALEKSSGVTFGIPSRLNEKIGIISFRKFQQLLDDYRYETDDKKVYQIPWQKYFSFGVDQQRIDGEFMTPELLAFLYDTELSVVQSDYQWGALNAFLSEIGESKNTYKWLFSEKALAMAQCKASYSFRKGNYGFVFNYVDGRIEGFEFSDNE